MVEVSKVPSDPKSKVKWSVFYRYVKVSFINWKFFSKTYAQFLGYKYILLCLYTLNFRIVYW